MFTLFIFYKNDSEYLDTFDVLEDALDKASYLWNSDHDKRTISYIEVSNADGFIYYMHNRKSYV